MINSYMIRKIKKLAGLNETITSNTDTNEYIESLIQSLPANEHKYILDMLEIVYLAKQLSFKEVVRQLKAIYTDSTDIEIIKKIIKEWPPICSTFIKRTNLDQGSNQIWHWNDPTEQLKGMLSSSIDMLYLAIEILKQHGPISLENWAERVSQAAPGIDKNLIREYINTVVQRYGDIEYQNNMYSYNEPKDPPIDFNKMIKPD